MSRKVSAAELVAVRTLKEQAWAYARSLEHLSYREMRRRATLAPDDGGLGYDISEGALKRLVSGYVESMREVLTLDREAELARITANYENRQRVYSAILSDPASTTSSRFAALNAMRLEDADRRKFLGLDQPVEVKVETTSRDGVIDDLNLALARLGESPVSLNS